VEGLTSQLMSGLGTGGAGCLHLVSQVRVSLVVEQQPHHVEVAVHGGHEEAREAGLHDWL
jgi:hypothetical protein